MQAAPVAVMVREIAGVPATYNAGYRVHQGDATALAQISAVLEQDGQANLPVAGRMP